MNDMPSTSYAGLDYYPAADFNPMDLPHPAGREVLLEVPALCPPGHGVRASFHGQFWLALYVRRQPGDPFAMKISLSDVVGWLPCERAAPALGTQSAMQDFTPGIARPM